MHQSSEQESREAAKELLLEDYRYLSDSFWRNEQTGETRVNWFIGIFTAVAGGLVALAGTEDGPRGELLRLLVIVSLIALLVFGLLTLLRIVKRNEITDGYKQDLDLIRQIFKDYFNCDNILLDYHPFRSKALAVPGDTNGKEAKRDVGRKLGGLTHTVSAINSLLVGGLAGAIVFPATAPMNDYKGFPVVDFGWIYGATFLSFILSCCLQVAFVNSREKESRRKFEAGKTTHAGGLVFRLENGLVKYLLVGPKVDKPNEWLFPKGHIEKKEEYGKAALREVREETGVAARLLWLVGSVEFVTSAERVRAKYYLMERLYESTRPESRRVNWFTFDEALEKLSHEENKWILCEAERRRTALCKPVTA